MNTKTFVTAIVGAVVGLGLAMGTMAFADHTGHMGNYQATQATSINQNSHENMHGKTVYGGNTHTLGQGMMGQSTQQNAKPLDIHGQMHGKTSAQNSYGGMHQQSAVTTHHAKLSQPAKNVLCHENTSAKIDAKT